MKRTKGPLKILNTNTVKWYIAQEYLPNKFGIVSGPFLSKTKAMSAKSDHHCCMLKKIRNKWFLTYRKNSGRWKKVKIKQIRM